jgi:transcriptional regulator with XRE-family HTH domain
MRREPQAEPNPLCRATQKIRKDQYARPQHAETSALLERHSLAEHRRYGSNTTLGTNKTMMSSETFQPCRFGDWVRTTRLDRGLTKTECARRAGLSVQRWSEIESRRLRRANHASAGVQKATVLQVADALEVSRETALRAAGLSEHSTVTETHTQPNIVHYFNELPRDVQEDVLEMVRALSRRHGTLTQRTATYAGADR